jgi:LysM repeat protein
MIHRHLLSSIALSISIVAATSLTSAQTTAAPATPSTPPPAAPATPTPPAATAPADTTTPAERPATYTIESGDTLWSISHKFNTSIKALQKENGLKKHALLHIGQVIKIPAATSDK